MRLKIKTRFGIPLILIERYADVNTMVESGINYVLKVRFGSFPRSGYLCRHATLLLHLLLFI